MSVKGFKLADKDRDELNNMEIDIQTVENDLRKAEEVGIDVKEQRDKIKQLRTTRDGLLKQF